MQEQSDSVAEAVQSIVVIGNFDGVHRGHQLVLDTAVTCAQTRGLLPILLTFDPHPAIVLGRTPPPLLTRVERKKELVASYAPAVRFEVAHFNSAYASQSPQQFVERLVGEWSARAVIVGQNFRFGKGRSGDIQTLHQLGEALGIDVLPVTLSGDARALFSSTRIRNAVAEGDLAEASNVLGRPHMISGQVVQGKRLGRTLGFPTCNLKGIAELLPPFGVYAVLVDEVDEQGPLACAHGVMSIGINPTTDTTTDTKVEVHLFDLDRDLYGKHLRVHLVQRIRGEAKFDSVDSLVSQMSKDCTSAREALSGRRPGAHGAFG